MHDSQDTTAWQQHLAGAPLVKPIPTDRLPRAPRLVEPLVCAVPLSEAAQRELIGADGTLAADLPMAALAALLLRYTGETDLIIGQVDEELTVPRLPVHGDTRIGDLRATAVRAIKDAAVVGAVDGAELLRLCETDGAATQAPCHGLIAIRPGDKPGHHADRHTESELHYADIVVVLQLVRGRPRAALVGNAALYERGTVNRLAKHLGGMLEAMVGVADDRTVSVLPLLDSAERGQILLGWNDTEEEVDPRPVHELIAGFARSTPDAPAVVHEGATTTFAELESGANRMANHLVSLGTTPGSNVGVFMERCPESLLTQLAIWKAGATAVLLDPEYPTERLAFMLQDSAAVAVVSKQHLAAVLPLDEGGARPVVLVDRHATTWQSAPDTDPAGPIDDESISHVAYTSGSTGVPKAVLLRHGPLRNTVHVLIRECEITAGSRGTWLCSPGFGLVEVDCFPVLAAGAVVHIPDPTVAASPEQQRDWLVDTGITHTLQLTAMAERLWTLPWPAECALRSMRIAGERVRAWPPPELPYTVLNVYGSAEANVVTTCDLTTTAAALTGDERAARMPPIGRPVANVRTYVLDERREPVPPGVLGELYISGESLSRGYLNRPDANTEKFLDNPLADDPYPVLYRSGDVARYWPDGVIEIVGRIDDETKVRGYRVHLGEVESVLAAQPGVRQCAVLAREDTPGYRRLVAYIEPDPVAPPQVRVLRGELARRLPPYMLPAAYVVDQLPTTANGKIDRAVLAPPPRTRPDLETPYQEPTTALEHRVGELLSEVLGIDEIGVLDEFFDLGGDSLRAMRLLSGLQQELDVSLTMADLFRAPTVHGIAQVIEAARHGAESHALVHDAANRYQPFPLTGAQRQLWRVRGNRPGPAEVYEWRRDWLDVDRFTAAWTEVVARHDSLRTVVRASGEQVALREGPPPEVVDLGVLSEPEALARVAEARADLRDTAEPHVLRLNLLPDGSVVVQLAVSPLTVDLDSAHRVLLPELATAYEEPGTVEAPAITFRDYAQSSLAKWAEADADGGAERSGPCPSGGVRAHLVELPVSVFDGLRGRAETAAATPADAIVAALHDVLAETDLGWLTGDQELTPLAVLAGLRVAGHPQVAALVGGFAGSRPVELADGGPTFAERARAVPDRLADRVPARCAVQIGVAVDGPPPGRAQADPVTAVVACGAFAVVDVRVVLDDDALRAHWTAPETADPTRVAALATAYRDRLTHLATDDAPWWEGVDAYNKSRPATPGRTP
ncbi:amino acid adenylation domain-containing protein [Actinokineospora auranticolor]|uniref:Amino acid adenylation domain-containing protein n=1 Tax=Actinokineospora auranticolor TaxID=155976 RepID=A0A2S6GD82_9PSEU|nr:amino acid adenylation domain-containing protein [Actinokineospora auranticolor]PPK63140.1 amino acid adenylation domain-containing protein [Actinokineospora auranticolor]